MTAMMTHSVRAITEGWMAFLRVLSSNYGIRFVIGDGVPAATDAKTVWLPGLPLVLTENDLDLFKANGFHEIGHVMHSDIPFFQAFAKQHGDFGRFLLNALDDVFMQNKQAATVRQAANYFRKSVNVLFERKQFRDGSASAAEAVACYVLCFLSAQSWSEYGRPLEVITENFNRHFGEHADAVRANLDDVLLSEFPSVQSTVNAGALALRIIAMLKMLGHEDEQKRANEQNEGKPQAAPGNQQEPGGSGGGPGESIRQPGGQPEQSVGQSGEGGTSGQKEKGGAAQAGQSGTAQANGASPTLKQIVDEIINATGLGELEVFDHQAAVKAVSASVAKGSNPDYKGQSIAPKCVIDGKLDRKPGKPGTGHSSGAGVGEVVDGISICPSEATEAQQMVRRLGRKPQVLASRLQALLMQQEEAEAIPAMRGQLGQANLYRFGLGDVRIFVQKDEVELPTTAVSLVLDLSSSTQDGIDKAFAQGGNPQFTATQAPSTLRSILESAVLLEKVLDQIGAPREILGFAPRVGELMSMVRSFGDNHQTALARLGGLRRIAGGGQTPIAEAVFHAGRRLIAHEANRKVMFVLTDGAPSNKAKAVEMTQYFERNGVRVVYLVIGSAGQSAWLAEAGIPFAKAETCEEVCPILLSEAKHMLS